MGSYADAATARSVSIGRVIGRAASALRTNPATMFGIAFVFGALPQMVISYGSQMLQVGQTRIELVSTVSIAAGLLIFVLSMLAQGALVRATIAASEGKTASFAQSAAAGLSVALPLVGLALLTGIALMAGFTLLFVPGVIFALMWTVATPVLVEERLGVLETFGRSAELTKGARWKILGLLLMVLVAYMLLTSVLGVVLLAGGMRGVTALPPVGLSTGWVLFNMLQGTLVAAAWGAVQTALYVELRDWKEGPTIDALAEIFA